MEPPPALFRADTPSESFTRQTFGTAPTNPTGMNLLILGSLAIVGIGGLIGLVTGVANPKETLPVTSAQKIGRVGLVGGLLGTGAYLYFSDQHAKTQPSVR